MPQIFTASADTRLRAAVLLLCLILLGILVWGSFGQSTYASLVGWVRDQPIPFSHAHHAGSLGIDCRYCHTTVETSARAGLPATEICMTCHSQLWTNAEMLAPLRNSLATGKPLEWRRVSRLPDYVYFDHSIHIDRGVPCATCHGRVDRMALMQRAEPFQMQWCLDCHRDPAPELRPPEDLTRMDWSGWDSNTAAHRDYGRVMMTFYGIDPKRLTQCDICHR